MVVINGPGFAEPGRAWPGPITTHHYANYRAHGPDNRAHGPANSHGNSNGDRPGYIAQSILLGFLLWFVLGPGGLLEASGGPGKAHG